MGTHCSRMAVEQEIQETPSLLAGLSWLPHLFFQQAEPNLASSRKLRQWWAMGMHLLPNFVGLDNVWRALELWASHDQNWSLLKTFSCGSCFCKNLLKSVRAFSSKAIWRQPHIFSFLGGSFKNFDEMKFVLPPALLSSSSPCNSHCFFGSRTSRRAIAFWLHCHSLTRFFCTPFEGKCIVFYCRVDSVTIPPPSISR